MNNILLIDDNREIHNSLRPIAAAHGYSLLSAYDGLSGLSMAQSCGADIIILDVMLPQSNGFALCRKIREAGCDTPVIFLTAKSDIVDKSIGFEAVSKHMRDVHLTFLNLNYPMRVSCRMKLDHKNK